MALNEPEPWAWQYQEYLDTHWQLQFLSSCPEARSHPSRECIAFGFVCKLMDTICYALQFLDVCIFYDKTMHRSWVLPSSGPGERERTVDRQILWTPLGRACNMWSRREWEASDEASSQSEGLLQIKQPIRGLVTNLTANQRAYYKSGDQWEGLMHSSHLAAAGEQQEVVGPCCVFVSGCYQALHSVTPRCAFFSQSV